MSIDTHTQVVSSDKVKHPLDPGARGWSTEVSNDVEDLIAEMDRECTLRTYAIEFMHPRCTVFRACISVSMDFQERLISSTFLPFCQA